MQISKNINMSVLILTMASGLSCTTPNPAALGEKDNASFVSNAGSFWYTEATPLAVGASTELYSPQGPIRLSTPSMLVAENSTIYSATAAGKTAVYLSSGDALSTAQLEAYEAGELDLPDLVDYKWVHTAAIESFAIRAPCFSAQGVCEGPDFLVFDDGSYHMDFDFTPSAANGARPQLGQSHLDCTANEESFLANGERLSYVGHGDATLDCGFAGVRAIAQIEVTDALPTFSAQVSIDTSDATLVSASIQVLGNQGGVPISGLEQLCETDVSMDALLDVGGCVYLSNEDVWRDLETAIVRVRVAGTDFSEEFDLKNISSP